MNTALLKLCRRHCNGARYWAVPGFSNEAKLLPATLTHASWGPGVYWPARDDRGEFIIGVDLDRQRKLAKQEIRDLMAAFPLPKRRISTGRNA